jgi:S-adenosylmethionine decarboxylase
MFIWPHKLILKTCGTTTLLLGLERIMELAYSVGFTQGAWRAFYSRKTFMWPERQKGPHRDWRDEMDVLDASFRTPRLNFRSPTNA